jgi:hypothetical protein
MNIIFAIDWKNGDRGAMIGNSQSMENAMSVEANKKLVQQIYADSASRSGTTFADNLAEDASGSSPASIPGRTNFVDAMPSRTA